MTRPHAYQIPARERPRLVACVRTACSRFVGLAEDLDEHGRVLNNQGRDIDKLRRIAGVGRIGGNGAFCAVGGSAGIKTGFETFGTPVPFELSAGARELARNIGDWGAYIVERQQWTRWGSYKGPLSEKDIRRRALGIAWHRGKEETWMQHFEVPDDFDAATDTLWTWSANVAPKGADRDALLTAGFLCPPGRAVYHRRTHPHGSWRRRLYAIVGLP